MRKKINILFSMFLYAFIFLFLLPVQNAFSLPASFLLSKSGNMRDVHWYRLESEKFRVYYDENSYEMGLYTLNSVEHAYPYLSRLLGVRIKNDSAPLFSFGEHRTLVSSFDKIPIVIGDRFEGPGFANPVTLSIEVQMIHPRKESFFQHELVHRLMYEHNDFHIGPIGRLFSLAMLPSWWIEGLAEYFTQSIGESETDAIERDMIAENYWPTWDRMHSLYNVTDDNFLRGYVSSGRFLGWIFSKTKEQDYYKIHEGISAETVSFPYFNASDKWLQKNLGEIGETLFEKFKLERKQYWEKYLNNLPSLFEPHSLDLDLKEKYVYDTNILGNSVYLSKMVSTTSPKSSAIEVKNYLNSDTKRLPLSNFGSGLFAINKEKDSEFVTTKRNKYSNGSYGDSILVYSFKGSISSVSNEKVVLEKEVILTTESNPIQIDKIQSVGNNGYFILSNLFGNTIVYYLNSLTGDVKYLKKYSFPMIIMFMPQPIENEKNTNNNVCVSYILDADNDLTSIQKICSDGVITEVLQDKKLVIKSGFELSDGIFRLLVKWDKLLAIVDVNVREKELNITPVSLFPELVLSITPWTLKEKNSIGVWSYSKGYYYFTKVSSLTLKKNLQEWQRALPESSLFKIFPKFTNYKPPFFALYKLQKEQLLNQNISEIEKQSSFKDEDNYIDKKTIEEQNGILSEENSPASYKNNFLFSYPFGLPTFLGGPSLGLIAVPLIDEMERYRVQIFGGYDFYVSSPSGAVTYINNRLLDEFSLSFFSAPFLNGYYDTIENAHAVRYYNYLKQTGLLFVLGYQFRPYDFLWRNSLFLTSLSPYKTQLVAPESIGAQSTLLAAYLTDFSFNLFNTSIYTENENKLHGEWLNLKTDVAIGGAQYMSLNDSKNSLGHSAGDLNYQNFNASLLMNAHFKEDNFSILGKISTTQGFHTLNLKELYAPYQDTSLRVDTSPLSYYTYPIYGSGSLFSLRSGYWSYSGTVHYDFPIYPDFGKKFLISFLEDWRFLLSISRGGTAKNTNFTKHNLITSASIGTSLTVDIKGFQLFPSFLYGKVIGESGWFVLMQLKFTNFT